jgi:hypothetical protein
MLKVELAIEVAVDDRKYFGSRKIHFVWLINNMPLNHTGLILVGSAQTYNIDWLLLHIDIKWILIRRRILKICLAETIISSLTTKGAK